LPNQKIAAIDVAIAVEVAGQAVHKCKLRGHFSRREPGAEEHEFV
jgi:hypothetical protein